MLKIHFLNVGNGDCCIIEFIDSSRVAIVDINRSSSMDDNSINEIAKSYNVSIESNRRFLTESLKDSGYTIELEDPIAYLNKKNIRNIWRFISTHPHMDNLSGLKSLYDKIGFNNIWVLKNSYSPTPSKLSDSQKEDWKLYKAFRICEENKLNGVTIIRAKEGSKASYYQEDGITILAPNNALLDAGNTNANEMSYVLLISYKGKKILLAGDAEENTWKHLLENYPDELSKISILKAAHHGRDRDIINLL